MACQPTDPCYNAACNDCNNLTQPCPAICPVPIYTNLDCLNPVDDKCVTITIPDNVCLGIVKPTKLDNVLNKIILGIKGLFSNITSNSLVITPTIGTCNKTATIEIVPSINAGNIFTLGSDGKPFVPISNSGIQGINIADTTSIDLSGNGNGVPLSGIVKIDPNVINTLSITPNGLFVAPVVISDTITLDISGNGTLASPIKGDVILNPSATNIITPSLTGLLTELEIIKDIKNNLKQHIIFERPPIKTLSWTGADQLGPFVASFTKMYLGNNGDYANNYIVNNSDVKLFWGDTASYENTLDNETGAGLSLSHEYGGLISTSGEIELKTYNNTFLTAIKINSNNTAPIGFKAIKGGELLTSVNIVAPFLSTSAVMDFKNMYNVQSLIIIPLYIEPEASYTLKNTQDLISLTSLTLCSFIEGSPNITLSNPAFSSLSIYRQCKGIKNLIVRNKTSLTLFMDTASVDTLDFEGSNLVRMTIHNCGTNFLSFINKLIFSLNPFSATGSMFNFPLLKSFEFFCTNGILNDGTVRDSSYNREPIPSKLLMYNKLNSNKIDFVSINQDWVKDEIFISLNANTLQKGFASFTVSPSFGLNFNAAYYNPTWTPLGGQPSLIFVTLSGTSINSIVNANNDSIGFNYNSIPQIITSGPGTGLAATTVMTLHNYTGINPITTPGSGYVVGNVYPFTGAGSISSVLIRVLSINGAGGIISSVIDNSGEFITLPSTLTNANGAIFTTTNLFTYKRSIINNGGSGYTDATIYKLEVTTSNGTGLGSASAQAKAAIESLHQKGWDLQW